MDNQGKYKEDLLSQYINPERIEKAPEGFTAKVMTQIQVESETVKGSGILKNRNLIPIISVAVTIFFIIAAFLSSGDRADSLSPQIIDIFNNIKVSLPEIDLTMVFGSNLPVLLVYVFVGILILSLFDRALNMIFHKEK